MREEEEEEEFQLSNACWICEQLMVTMQKSEIIVTQLVNLEAQIIGVLTQIFN